MALLTALATLIAALMLQMVIFSRITLLHGSMDLVLLTALSWIMFASRKKPTQSIFRLNRGPGQSNPLFNRLTLFRSGSYSWALIAGLLTGYASAIPAWTPVLAYLLIAMVGNFIRQRVWQVPMLGLLTGTIAGSLILNLSFLVTLRITGVPIDLLQAVNLVILPSVLLNLIGIIPVNGLVGEIANLVLPADPDEAEAAVI